MDSQFTYKFCKDFFVGLGTQLAFTLAYHLQIDGQREGQYDIGGHVEDAFDVLVDEIGGVPSIG